jgi:hypothetical protein
MQNPTNNTQVPANLAVILQANGLPMPTGTNDNGEPFWMINDQTVSWAQMQQVIWVQQQSRAQQGGGKSSPEAMPTMAMPEASFDSVPDIQFENQIEKGIEQQKNQAEQGMESGEKSQNSAATPQTAPVTATQQKRKSYVGDSPVLKSVDTTSEESMLSFVEDNINQPTTSSKHFLAVMLNKVLAALSLDKN